MLALPAQCTSQVRSYRLPLQAAEFLVLPCPLLPVGAPHLQPRRCHIHKSRASSIWQLAASLAHFASLWRRKCIVSRQQAPCTRATSFSLSGAACTGRLAEVP